MKQKTEVGNASLDEIADELGKLSDKQLQALTRWGDIFCLGIPSMDSADLLGISIERALSGSRNWNKTIPFIQFLRGTISSVADQYWKKEVSKSKAGVKNESDYQENSIQEISTTSSQEQEWELEIKRILSNLEKGFEDDSDAFFVVMGKVEGLSVKEIQSELGINEKAYDTIRRRIHRKLPIIEKGIVNVPK